MAISQKDRLLSLKTPLADDLLCANSVTLHERLSGLFSLQLEMVAENAKASQVTPQALLGKKVTLTMQLDDGKKRFFNGVVSRFGASGSDPRFATFRAEVVPWLWLLTLTSDCKVFQDKSVPEILEEVLNEWKGKLSELVDFEKKLNGSYRKIDYCVQYRETDFNFLSRIMEQEGIFYYFKHQDGKHTLVLADDASAFSACPHQPKVPYLPESGQKGDGVSDWEARHSVVPGKYVLSDYHFQMSSSTIRPTANGPVQGAGNDQLEHYDIAEFAERFNKPDERLGDVQTHGDEVVKWRAEEQTAGHFILSGASTCRDFSAGAHFTLHGKQDAPIKAAGTEGTYVLSSVSHSVQQSPGYVSEVAPRQPYRNTFTCIPKEKPFRPARVTPRPAVQGPQTAVVVGLKGEEIDCDKYGRVKIQFHWDREGKKDEKSSCWVRVSTPWAGAQWGMIHIPRIGQEVVVAFLEGDPDQPLIVGSVYNYDHMPPYKLPDNKTQSGIKTRSTLKGDAENFNELCFEDKKGEELIYLRAEKDLKKAVENDETIWVGNDRWAEVDNKDTLIVDKSDRDATLKKGNDKLKIELGNRESKIETGNDTLTISKGNQTTKLDLGKSSLEAMQAIELKVGSSSITIDQTGVKIAGLMVEITGNTKTAVSGLMVQVAGSAMTEVTGGLVKIN